MMLIRIDLLDCNTSKKYHAIPCVLEMHYGKNTLLPRYNKACHGSVSIVGYVLLFHINISICIFMNVSCMCNLFVFKAEDSLCSSYVSDTEKVS